MTVFAPKFDLQTFLIDGRVYFLSPYAYDIACPVRLISDETSKLPLETVRFIGCVPWRVKRVFQSRGRLSNLVANGVFKVEYRIEWEQVGPKIVTIAEFLRIVADSLVSKVNGN